MFYSRSKTVFMTALVMVLCMSSTGLSAYASSKANPLVQLNFDSGTRIYGLTAWNSLGKNTGTLAEFAEKSPLSNTSDYLIFPANFFHAYDNVRDVIGGIYSQGEIVYDSWFDFGCGFDANGTFHLFSLISTVSNERDGKIIIQDGNGKDVDIVTAFNCYPWLIKDGELLDITPTPAASANFLNSRSQRAFMGQTSDGTFMYGMVPSTTIYGLQEVCRELGLVNAVNTDGGASAGAYRNGSYLAHPGRELASVVYIAHTENAPASEANNAAFDTGGITVLYRGNVVEFTQPSVERNGYIFYPLEDVLVAFTGGHSWNNESHTVYGVLDGNMVAVPLLDPSYLVNGVALDVPANLIPFVENDRTYVYLDYIVEGFGLSVEWDGTTRTISIH